jgi:hypothetical protein
MHNALVTYSPGGSTHDWTVVATWTLRAVGDVGLGTAREAIPTLWTIRARVQLGCTGFVCTHGALVAASRGGILEEASVAVDGIVPSRNGPCNMARRLKISPDSSGTVTNSTLPGMFAKKVTCTSSTLALMAKIAPPYKLHVAPAGNSSKESSGKF